MKRWMIALIAGVMSSPVYASLSDEMDGMLNDMSNYTAPDAFKTQRRGVLSGGSFVSRNRIMQENLVSASPPSFSAGCGGIDLFGGSFSYVNADRLIQLFRNIASNASGYAFQIALKEMCESCMQTIETIQKKVQQLNEFSMSSCEMAQGVVNDTTGAMISKEHKTSATIMSNVGGWGDTAQSLFTEWGGDKGAAAKVKDVAPDEAKERVYGNLVWRALKKHSVESWFTYGDNTLMESIMSLTGTVVVRPDDTKDTGVTYDYPMNPLKIRDLVNGGKAVPRWQCVDGHEQNECLEFSLLKAPMEGLAAKIERILIGGPSPFAAGGSSVGVLTKMRDPYYTLATSKEEGFLAALPSPYGTLLRRITAFDEKAARSMVLETSKMMALGMVRQLTQEMYRAVRQAAATADSAHAIKLRDHLREVREELKTEYDALDSDEKSIIAYYQNYMDIMESRKYTDYQDAMVNLDVE